MSMRIPPRTRYTLDCLNVLRWIVTCSGVSLIWPCSVSIVAELGNRQHRSGERTTHAPGRKFLFERFQSGLVHLAHDLLYRARIPSEGLSEHFLVKLGHLALRHDRLLEGFPHDEGMPRTRRMHRQVIRRPVRTTDTLCPPGRVLDLGIPTVGCVMGHLVGHVLPEAQAVRVDPDAHQKELYARQKVAECLVGDDAACDSLPGGHGGDGSVSACLRITIEQREHDVLVLRKMGVALIIGVDIVLDLAHGKLAHAEETRTWRDLVAERAPDLCRCKRDAAIVELEEARKVEKVALGCFWAKEAGVLTGGADAAGKHEVELLGLAYVVVGVGVADRVGAAERAKLWARVVVELGGVSGVGRGTGDVPGQGRDCTLRRCRLGAVPRLS